MPSKYNLDVNIVNYLIAHKGTFCADSATNDVSFLRPSWREGSLLLENITVCITLVSHPPEPDLLEAAVSASQRGDLF